MGTYKVLNGTNAITLTSTDQLMASGNTLYYTAGGQTQIWTYRGSGSPVQIPIELNNGNSRPLTGIANLTAAGSTLYFTAADMTDGSRIRLWEYVGSGVATRVLGRAINQANPYLIFSAPPTLTVLTVPNGVQTVTYLVFAAQLQDAGDANINTADDGVWGYRVSGRVSAQIAAIIQAVPAGYATIGQLTVSGQAVYFVASSNYALYRTTFNGSVLVATPMYQAVNGASGTPGPSGFVAVTSPAWLADAGGTLYYASGYSIWKWDSRNNDFFQLSNTYPGAPSGIPTPSSPVGIGNDGYIVFSTIAAGSAASLQISESQGSLLGFGTQAQSATQSVIGATLTSAVTAPSNGQLASDETLSISVNGQPSVSVTISRAATLGNTSLAQLVAQINSALAAAGLGASLNAAVGSRLFFTAVGPSSTRGGNTGVQLWSTDGTVAGTQIVRNINTNPYQSNNLSSNSSYPANLTAVSNLLYFTATDATGDTELWQTDGTQGDTIRVTNFDQLTGITAGSFVAVGSGLYFQANDGTGVHLFKSNITDSDGTNLGTGPRRPGPGGRVGRRILHGRRRRAGRSANHACRRHDHGHLFEDLGHARGDP